MEQDTLSNCQDIVCTPPAQPKKDDLAPGEQALGGRVYLDLNLRSFWKWLLGSSRRWGRGCISPGSQEPAPSGYRPTMAPLQE